MRLLKSRPRALLLGLAVAAILATAAATPSAALAQAPPTDVSISLRHGYRGDQDGHDWFFALTNVGGREPVSGQVQISFTRHADGAAVGLHTTTPKVYEYPRERGATLGPEHGRFDRETQIWHFRNLRPGHGIELVVSTFSTPDPTRYRNLVKGRAEIISTIPKESAMYIHNNVAEGWKIQGGALNQKVEGNAQLEMQVSDRSPASGDTTDFTVKFLNRGDDTGSFYEDFPLFGVEVEVVPSTGLEFVSASPPSGNIGTRNPFSVATTFDSGTGTWNIGYVPDHEQKPFIDLPVTYRYNGDVPLEEACLTAELKSFVPPEDPNPIYRRDNRVEVCLGDDPTVLFQRGEISLFTVYPCVGATAYPCNAQDTLELVAVIERDVMREEGIGIDRFEDKVIGSSGLRPFSNRKALYSR